MENISTTSTSNGLSLGHVGWKYYSEIKKKAMDKEFSWSGLLISLSVAFFIVILASFCLHFIYISWEQTNVRFFSQDNLYLLEDMHNNHNYIQIELLSSEKQEIIRNHRII